MATYKKNTSVGGKWAKTSELTGAGWAKIVSETNPQPSTFLDKNGNAKNQDVAKVQFDGQDEPLNVSLNRATINGLVDAFGEDSKEWQGAEAWGLYGESEGRRQERVCPLPHPGRVQGDGRCERLHRDCERRRRGPGDPPRRGIRGQAGRGIERAPAWRVGMSQKSSFVIFTSIYSP
jgi:hypothetical protein